jgi:hypothetical protein
MKITKETFKSVLNDVYKSARSVRDNIQSLIEFAAKHYANEANNSDASLMTSILKKAIDTKGINARQMQLYMQEVANVRWVEDKGVARFKRVKSASEPVVNITGKWYTFEHGVNKVVALDESKFIHSKVVLLEEKIKEKKVKNEHNAKIALQCLKDAEAAYLKKVAG